MKRRISKLDSLVKEMMKIHEAYQALKELLKKSAKLQGEIAQLAQINRELLKKSARAKLQGEIAQLAQMNKELNNRSRGTRRPRALLTSRSTARRWSTSSPARTGS